MALDKLNPTQHEQLLELLTSGRIGPIHIACSLDEVLGTLGEPDYINVQYFGPVNDRTYEVLANGRTENIRIDTYPDYDHDLLLEHYSYGRLQITFQDRLISHFILTYNAQDESYPAGDDTNWLSFLGTLTHGDLQAIFAELNCSQHIYYYEGYDNEGPMLIRPDKDFDVDFVVGAEGPLDKIMVSGHRVRGIPTVQIDLD